MNKFPGTTFVKARKTKQWKAQTTINGKPKGLGYFDTVEEAYQAVVAAKQQDAGERAQIATHLLPLPADVPGAIQQSRRHTQIAQHNKFLDQPMDLNILETRIFVLILRCIHKKDEKAKLKTKTMIVSLADLYDKPLGGREYKFLHQALEVLGGLKIKPFVQKNDKDIISLFERISLDSRKGIITALFTESALPYVSSLTDNFTLGEVADLLAIKNRHTYHFYWLLRRYHRPDQVTPKNFTVDELRELTTGVDTYQNFSDYRARIMKPSINELNAMGDGQRWDIQYEEKMAGRTTTGVKFTYTYTPPEKLIKAAPGVQLQLAEHTTPQAPTEALSPEHQKVATRLGNLKLTQPQIQHVLKFLGADEVKIARLMKLTYPLHRDLQAGNKIPDNLGGATINLLKTEFGTLYATLK